MDRPISASSKRQAWRKYVKLAVVFFAAGVLILTLFKYFFKVKVKRSEISIATVDSGEFNSLLSGSGVVLSAKEYIVTSSIASRLESILHNVGDSVAKGVPLLMLNKQFSRIAYEKLLDEQKININKFRQTQLLNEKEIDKYKTSYKTKELEIKQQQGLLANEKILLQLGGATKENVDQLQLKLDMLELELTSIKQQISNEIKKTEADLQTARLQINIQAKVIDESRLKLEQAEVYAPQTGIVTWLNSKVGSEINPGDELARVADLKSLMVEGKVSESFAPHVYRGAPVRIVGELANLQGSISLINPNVESGVIKFSVMLHDSASQYLRPNSKVDLFLVTSGKKKVVRILAGPAVKPSSNQTVFLVKEDVATKVEVRLGDADDKYIQVLSGLKEGDQVILTELEEFNNYSAFNLY